MAEDELARLRQENSDLRLAIRYVVAHLAMLDGEPPDEDAVNEARETAVKACQALEWKTERCDCPGCPEQIPEWWASIMCLHCATEDCQHEEPADE